MDLKNDDFIKMAAGADRWARSGLVLLLGMQGLVFYCKKMYFTRYIHFNTFHPFLWFKRHPISHYLRQHLLSLQISQ